MFRWAISFAIFYLIQLPPDPDGKTQMANYKPKQLISEWLRVPEEGKLVISMIDDHI